MATEQLSAAVEAASSEARTAYGGFTAFALYFAVTVGATTHEELLRGSQVTMPALGVGLPMVGFYTLVPPLFVLFHALLLIQLDILAARGRQLQTAGSATAGWYGPPFVLSQLVLGGIDGRLLRPLVHAAVATSLILLPIGILLLVQVRFLPYHSDAVTLWHRILVVLDLALVWLLWPNIVRTPYQAAQASRRRRPAELQRASGLALALRDVGRHPRLLALTALVLVFSCGFARIPPRPADYAAAPPDCALQRAALAPPRAEATCGWLRPTWLATVASGRAGATSPPPVMSCLSYLLFEAPTTPLNMRRHLRLASVALTGPPPPESAIAELGLERAWREQGLGLDLRGRDLRYADLSSSDLRKADLRGADLLGATLQSADLRYADAGVVPLRQASACQAGLIDQDPPPTAEQRAGDAPDDRRFCRSRLRGAQLENARLQFARLRKADLREADIDYADLRASDLDSALLCDASLKDVSLQGAVLNHAELDRADLTEARLAGAGLSAAQLRGAKLPKADLRFVHLKAANLTAAVLSDARLDGAFLPAAQLAAADLSRAYVAGANLRGAGLQGAELGDVAGEAFFGWSDLSEVEPAALKELDATQHAILPRILPRADRQLYEDDLALLLHGKACRADASPAVLQSLVKRLVDEIELFDAYRLHHVRIARQLVADLERAAPACRQARSLPSYMRNSLHAIGMAQPGPRLRRSR